MCAKLLTLQSSKSRIVCLLMFKVKHDSQGDDIFITFGVQISPHQSRLYLNPACGSLNAKPVIPVSLPAMTVSGTMFYYQTEIDYPKFFVKCHHKTFLWIFIPILVSNYFLTKMFITSYFFIEDKVKGSRSERRNDFSKLAKLLKLTTSNT